MTSFDDALKVVTLFDGFRRPWFVAGGWALDLFIGRVTREHEDVEIAIFRQDQLELQRHLAGWELAKVPYRSGALEAWRDGEWLALPVHEIHARREEGDPRHLEILLNEGSTEEGEWRFRKRPEIVRPLSLAIMRSPGGVPYLAPEIVLLYKAASAQRREKDEADFEAVLPLLGAEQRDWLRQALEARGADHPWLAQLG